MYFAWFGNNLPLVLTRQIMPDLAPLTNAGNISICRRYQRIGSIYGHTSTVKIMRDGRLCGRITDKVVECGPGPGWIGVSVYREERAATKPRL
jgi:hypothetical protein